MHGKRPIPDMEVKMAPSGGARGGTEGGSTGTGGQGDRVTVTIRSYWEIVTESQSLCWIRGMNACAHAHTHTTKCSLGLEDWARQTSAHQGQRRGGLPATDLQGGWALAISRGRGASLSRSRGSRTLKGEGRKPGLELQVERPEVRR